MTRERLEAISRNDLGAVARELWDALDALLPWPEIKAGDVVVRRDCKRFVMFRVVDERGGWFFYDCDDEYGEVLITECRLATPAERAVFEEWERGKG